MDASLFLTHVPAALEPVAVLYNVTPGVVRLFTAYETATLGYAVVENVLQFQVTAPNCDALPGATDISYDF